MKRAFVATLGLALVAVMAFGLFGTGTVSANHVVAPDEITIASPQAGTAVAVGSNITFTLAVTTSTAPHKAIQWEVAYPSNLTYVSSTYTCTNPSGINYPAETDTAPVESPLIPGVKNLGGGSNCASLSGSFNGAAMTGTFVTVVLSCDAVGNDAVSIRPLNEPANPANDPLFGTTLLDKDANVIPTTLENQVPLPGFGNQAAITFACATPVDYSVQKSPPSQNVSGDAPSNVANQTISIANPDTAAHAVFLDDTVPAGATVTTSCRAPVRTAPSVRLRLPRALAQRRRTTAPVPIRRLRRDTSSVPVGHRLAVHCLRRSR